MKHRSGYPREHLNDKRQSLKLIAQQLAFVGAITAVFYGVGLYDIGFLAFAALSGAVGIWLLWAYIVTALAKPLLALYFEAEVSGEWVWSKTLARNCVYLDALAVDSSQLSEFGFADDLSGEIVVWHSAYRGLETVEQLLQKLRAEPEILRDSAAIIADLEKMSERLQQACATDTRFCLILHSDGINLMEIEMRKGHF